ncbi:MAG: ABC transporter ATP-binding protein [Ignavibacteria bacterium]|nr:ABC transporter ATP-binding protein [Ignavibacteria bacterium]
MIEIEISKASKWYGNRPVLKDVSFRVTQGVCFGILGSNGSGKSTLLQILGGIQRPNTGTVSLSIDGTSVISSEIPYHCGMVAPYLRIYDEFSPLELLNLHSKLHGKNHDAATSNEVLERVGLDGRKNDTIREFSSGLLQRMLLALAVHLQQPLLLLDEPSVTMDPEGRKLVVQEIHLHKSKGGIVLLATNDEQEKTLCDAYFQL